MRTTRNGWLIVCGLILVVAIGHVTARVVAQSRRATGGTPLSEPRIPRVEKPWTDAERELLAPRERNGQVIGVWSTCAKSPDLCRAWLGLTDYLLSDSTLPVRDRELLILRIAWLTHGAYEWAAHVGLARRVGLSEADVRRILDGPDVPGWTAWDRTLLRAVDDPVELGKLLCGRAELERATGAIDAARTTLHEAEALAVRVEAGSESELGRKLVKLRHALGGDA